MAMMKVPRTSHYINGEWRTDPATVDVLNPATEETITAIPDADASVVADALTAAQDAQEEWGARPGVERAEVIRDLGTVLEAHVGDVGDVLMAEQGKPKSAADGEVSGTLTLADYTAGWGRRIEGDIVPSDNRDEQIQLQRHPIGVIAAIIPWNYPIAVLMRKILPALVAGNAIVVKPSSTTPLSTARVFELFDEHLELPDGLLNLVQGTSDTGDALVSSPDTDMVTMTGSTRVGKKIMKAAASNLTPVSLELGGKAPAIVAADADIEAAVEDILTARITNAGQVCTCAERAFVHEDVAHEFTERYIAATEALELGMPESDPDMGPQVTQGELNWTHTSVESAVENGARVLAGGGPPEGSEFESGFWYAPTVLGGVEPSMDVVEREVFGPVTPIVPVESVNQAVEYANRSRYGLSSYVYTEDYQTAMRTVEALDYGETYVNRTLGEAWQGHHVGWNESGIGGDDGKYGVLKYTRIKGVYHNYS